jgi:hypothetical protein
VSGRPSTKGFARELISDIRRDPAFQFDRSRHFRRRSDFHGGNMQYMMLIYLNEKSLSEQVRNQCYADSAGYAKELASKGKLIAVAPLQPTATATSVRHSEGNKLVTDGPFAETREQLGGFFVVEAKSRDEAIEIAGQIPAGRWGTVEIRPLVELQGLPVAAGR